MTWVRVLKSRERMERRTSMQPMYCGKKGGVSGWGPQIQQRSPAGLADELFTLLSCTHWVRVLPSVLGNVQPATWGPSHLLFPLPHRLFFN